MERQNRERGSSHGGGLLRRGPGHGPVGESPSLAQLQNQQNRDQHYLALPVPKYSETNTYKTVEQGEFSTLIM
jgi:hypothetical protein